jgi:hypothetical protein
MGSFSASKRSSVHPQHDEPPNSSDVDPIADSVGQPYTFTV